jgi:predicted DNA-binding transcriptional regulator AlpA
MMALTRQEKMMKNGQLEKLLTRQEVEDRFGISKRFLEVSACRSSGPPYIKLSRSVFYRAQDIHDWIENQRITPEGNRAGPR